MGIAIIFDNRIKAYSRGVMHFPGTRGSDVKTPSDIVMPLPGFPQEGAFVAVASHTLLLLKEEPPQKKEWGVKLAVPPPLLPTLGAVRHHLGHYAPGLPCCIHKYWETAVGEAPFPLPGDYHHQLSRKTPDSKQLQFHTFLLLFSGVDKQALFFFWLQSYQQTSQKFSKGTCLEIFPLRHSTKASEWQSAIWLNGRRAQQPSFAEAGNRVPQIASAPHCQLSISSHNPPRAC